MLFTLLSFHIEGYRAPILVPHPDPTVELHPMRAVQHDTYLSIAIGCGGLLDDSPKGRDDEAWKLLGCQAWFQFEAEVSIRHVAQLPLDLFLLPLCRLVVIAPH